MITIFTPAYNRSYTLKRLYDSLVKQTCKDFEWLIVDDGSTDNTELLVNSFVSENKIDIYYRVVVNGGKHRAVNLGVTLARGDFFFILDSDDYLPDNAVERVLYFAQQIQCNILFAGVCGLRIYSDGQRVGGEATYNVLDTDTVSFREKYHIKGDMAEVFKTDVLLKYPFPEFNGEKFLSEAIVWNRIAKQYKLRYFYEGIYICDYLPDGLTKSIKVHHRNSPKGTMLFYNELLIDKRNRMRTRVIAAINYWRYTLKYNGSREGGLKPIWWSYLCYPLGVFFIVKIYWKI